MARALERDEDFRDFVEAHWLGLVRSAYLLVCDHGAAEDLVEQTLASVYPQWHRRVREGAPVAYVHDAMVHRAISDLRRRKVLETLFGAGSGEGSAVSRPRDDAPRGPQPADAYRTVGDGDVVVGTLRELPPRVRAVIVLLYVDDLTEAATADVLGMSVRSVRREASRGLQRLQAAMVTGPAGTWSARTQRVTAGEHMGVHIVPARGDVTATSTPLGDDVRLALLIGTEHLSVPSDAYVRVVGSATVKRHRRYSGVAAAGIASVVLAGVVGLAAGVAQDDSRVITPTPDRVTERLRETDGVIGPEFDWPVRGGLGTDPAFAAEFDRAFGADHRLLYAESAEAGQVAIAISSRGDTVVFTGPPDAAVEELARFVGLSAVSQDITVAVPVSDGHLVIALMPDRVRYAQISLPSVGRSGSINRNWLQMPVQQGVARFVTGDSIGTVRVRTPVGDGAVHVVAGGFDEPGALACGPCDSSWVAQDGPSQFRDEAAAAVGAAAEDVTSRLLLDATVPAAGGRIVSYVADVPTGGLLRATYVVADLASGDSNLWMVEPLRPLPVFDADRPLVFTAQPSGDLVIVAPTARRISFSPIGDAPALPDVRLTDGVGVLAVLPPDLASYRIFAYAPDGSLSGAWHGSILRVDDPLQVRYRLGARPGG
ncbi:MAG: SigE family RNA polymerase sigma factor [Dermatophilaceae bacterium]